MPADTTIKWKTTMPDWIYDLARLLDLWGHLVSAVFVGLVIVAVGPKVRAWLRLQSAKGEAQRQEYTRLVEETRRADLSDTERRAAARDVRRWVLRETVKVVLPLGGIALAWWGSSELVGLAKEDERRAQEGMIRTIDERREDYLYFKAVSSPVAAEADLRQAELDQVACTLRAVLDGRIDNHMLEVEGMRLTGVAYRACMAERGVLVEHCSSGEPNCIEIPYAETACTSLTRRFLRGDVGETTMLQCGPGGSLHQGTR